MSIADIFDSGFRKRNQDHFAAIVKVAMSDGVVTESEKAFLDRLAVKLEISDTKYKQILKDFESHPINAPHAYNRRLERLFDLARMVRADGIEGQDQVRLLEKFCVGLGFNSDNVKYIADKALKLVFYNVEFDEFVDRMKNMNQ